MTAIHFLSSMAAKALGGAMFLRPSVASAPRWTLGQLRWARRAGLVRPMDLLGHEPDELSRLLSLREELLRVLEPRPGRARRVLLWLEWRRLRRTWTIEPDNDP